jgi:hypothetical protein
LYNFTTPVYRIDTSDANATASQMLSGYTAYVEGSKLAGAIDDCAADGNGLCYVAQATMALLDADLAAGNIKSGATIFGVSGNANVTDTSDANATADKILSSYTAYVSGAKITGTISTETLSADSTTVDAGYYAATTLDAVDADLATANIRNGTTIFGIAGDSNVVDTSDANATAAQILSGYTAYVDGSKLIGSLLNCTADGTGICYVAQATMALLESNLISANIKNGTTIFGIAGDSNVVDTSDANATAAQILANQVCWADGSEVTGTMPTQTLSSGSVNVAAGYYEATTLNATDSDLAAANIASGVNIFGIEGSLSGGGVELHSGQQTCWDTSGTPRSCTGTGEDAELDGTAKSFTDNGDGTVTDDHTGIMW